MDERYFESKIEKMTFLKINNLSVDYQMRKETVYAAKDVNIEVNKGEILGLVGESGSGKSTVGNACLLYTSPSPRDYAASRMPSSA